MSESYQCVEISFAAKVEITDADMQEFVALADKICKRYEANHPARVMWPSGIGFKPTYIPMTQEEEQEQGMEFDESTFSIECFERENYEFKCVKCGLPQGDHGHCYQPNPPAGACEFASTQ
jgi:hypothetical protein